MKVLVTGGLGVVGSTIARRLVEAGHQVTVWDAGEAQRNLWIGDRLEGVKIYTGRIEERLVIPYDKDAPIDATFASLVLTNEAVIHCAASTGIPHSVEHPDDDWRSNVDATRVLLETLRNHPIPTVVLSSVKPYKIVPEDIDRGIGLDESYPLVPDEPYAASKAAQSMLAMAYARSYGIPVVTFRCSNLYGPAPCHGPRHGWLTWFCISAAIGRPIEVQGTGKQSRDMLHADDVHAACMLALKQAKELSGRVFNLGGGKANRISVSEAAAKLVELGGSANVTIATAPARAMDDLHVFADTSAFLKATAWRPLVGVDEGLRSVYEWARSNAESLRSLYWGM